MPRRKPNSGKQKKAEKQLKKAIKRGDVPAPEKPKNPRNKRRRVQIGQLTSPEGAARSQALSSKRLASAFAKLSPEFLALAKERASNEELPRPLSFESTIFPSLDTAGSALTCPKRPKWRYDMEKKEVERNEEGLFAKWLAETDRVIEEWRRPPPPTKSPAESEEDSELDNDPPLIEKAPTYFERNLEVWRQLWRVIEASEILLVLLDCRCPPVHYPESFHSYLKALKPQRKVILVLTKVDVAGQQRANAWESWLKKRYDNVRVVQSSSYREVDTSGQVQGRTREPFLPKQFREDLLSALKDAHAELCNPPDILRDDPEKLKRWTPRVKTDIDWSGDYEQQELPTGAQETDNTADVDEPSTVSDSGQEWTPPKYLTIGLIGQPNVGKSSLLNALFGHHKVKASRTPGKTKHFQTLFLSPQIRLVDCPGLVFPSFVPMELQVLSAILPISQIPSIPSCIQFALQHVPIEKMLKLQHPSASEKVAEDKRTWRGEKPAHIQSLESKVKWTTMDVLTAYALKNGWVTAKAGRPDVNRAGNALLRMLAEAKVSWGFLPPDTKSEDVSRLVSDPANGIWIGDATDDAPVLDDESDFEPVEPESEDEEEDDEPSDDDDDGDESEGKVGSTNVPASRFGALRIEDDGANDSAGSDDE